MKVWIVIGILVVYIGVGEAVKLRWKPPMTGEPVGYSVYRHTDGGGRCAALPIIAEFLFLASAGLTLVNGEAGYEDTTPVPGANYYYVTAYNSEGESLASNQVCFQRQAEKPGPPVGLRVE